MAQGSYTKGFLTHLLTHGALHFQAASRMFSRQTAFVFSLHHRNTLLYFLAVS